MLLGFLVEHPLYFLFKCTASEIFITYDNPWRILVNNLYLFHVCKEYILFTVHIKQFQTYNMVHIYLPYIIRHMFCMINFFPTLGFKILEKNI